MTAKGTALLRLRGGRLQVRATITTRYRNEGQIYAMLDCSAPLLMLIKPGRLEVVIVKMALWLPQPPRGYALFPSGGNLFI
jgi:hypothetical protein